MADLMWRAGKYLGHRSKANTRHGTHSPFVYKLLDEVVYNDRHFYAYDSIAKRRNELLADQSMIKIIDLGAGSSINPNKTRRVSDVAQNSLKNEKISKLIFRLINHFQPKTMVELGTSLGISGLHQALAFKGGKLHTFEGCPETAKIAQVTFDKAQVENVTIYLGDFAKTLQPFLDAIENVDFAFLDGNHQYQPTVDYFNQILPKCHEGTVMLLDDIYWSKGMAKAWEEVKSSNRVSCSIDMFHIGIVFFRIGQEKEHFKIKF
jgi:predicted O-methyltransferase YrrM